MRSERVNVCVHGRAATGQLLDEVGRQVLVQLLAGSQSSVDNVNRAIGL